jgi:hypothetical protein
MSTLLIMPPLSIDEDLLHSGLRILSECIGRIEEKL